MPSSSTPTLQPLVIATHNNGKLVEMRDILAGFPFSLTSAGELHLPEPEETGHTFIENAIIKALSSATLSGLPALADDSGLVVPALNGDPGIYSARWAGANKDFTMASMLIKDKLEASGHTAQGTAAYFVCALALAMPDGTHWHFEGRVHGTLTFPPRGTLGFGYDPIFCAENDTRTFAEILPEEKHAISHRNQAFLQFKAWIAQNKTF